MKYLALDLEIAKILPHKERDLLVHRPLGIACAATLLAGEDEPKLWYSKREDGTPAPKMLTRDCYELVKYLEKKAQEGWGIVTWNGLKFDFIVLRDESEMLDECNELAIHHSDLMFHFFCLQGYWISLAKAAEGMQTSQKSVGIQGAMVPRIWAAAAFKDVFDYVSQDVRTTLEIAHAIDETGLLRWVTQKGRLGEVSMPNGCLSTKDCFTLPKPDTSWLTGPVPRELFTCRWDFPK